LNNLFDLFLGEHADLLGPDLVMAARVLNEAFSMALLLSEQASLASMLHTTDSYCSSLKDLVQG
jgi:hypothetical protein